MLVFIILLQGELWFFDNYVIPLAKKLDECGVLVWLFIVAFESGVAVWRPHVAWGA